MKMELKVWVEGIQRIVCGVTNETTCQDVVFALAHATGKIGRFTLIERWRNNERLLAPNENPLKILMKWGEYSHDVQFILQRSDQPKGSPSTNDQATTKNPASTPTQAAESPKKAKSTFDSPTMPYQSTELQTISKDHQMSDVTFNVNETRKSDIIGIVKGVPHTTLDNLTKISPPLSSCSSLTGTSIASDFPDIDYTAKLPLSTKSPAMEFNTAAVRDSLDRKTGAFGSCGDDDNSQSNNSINSANNFDTATDLYKNGPPISSIGALLPPPYRNPPSPKTGSPVPGFGLNMFDHQRTDSQSSGTTNSSSKILDFGANGTKSQHFVKELSPPLLMTNTSLRQASPNIHINALNNLQTVVNSVVTSDKNLLADNHFQTAQYRELLQLIHYQREKITSQQVDISKFDAEINYLENRERDQIQQLDAINREINKTDRIFWQSNEQLQTLQYVEEENQLVRQQEKTLKSEITLLRSKLANCETELLQCKNKIRLLMDDIQMEQTARNYDGQRHQIEIGFLHEMERIQCEIDLAVQCSESSNKISDSLKMEVSVIESAIAEKKKQLEKLVNEMKEVNLQSLTVASTEEIRNLLEGSHRPGSTRRIMGSPRQLETAVPTSKNPHGVWV